MKFLVWDLDRGYEEKKTVFETSRQTVLLELPGVNRWLQIRLEGGVVYLTGSNDLVIRPHAEHVVHIEVEQ